MDSMPDTYPQLFAGYAVIWILIVGYLFWLGRKISTLEKDR